MIPLDIAVFTFSAVLVGGAIMRTSHAILRKFRLRTHPTILLFLPLSRTSSNLFRTCTAPL
jgi:hypothetical protein